MPNVKAIDHSGNLKAAMWMTSKNCLAPFASVGKPTCGYYFSRETDHKRRLTGMPYTRTVTARK